MNFHEALYSQTLALAHQLRSDPLAETDPATVTFLSYGSGVEVGEWTAFAQLAERWALRERKEQITGAQETLLICDLKYLKAGTRAAVLANTAGVVISNLIYKAALRHSIQHPYATVFHLESTGESWDPTGLQHEDPLIPLWQPSGAPPSAGGSGQFEIGEFPAGAINGSNATFISIYDFIPESVEVQINGIVQRPGIDFTTSGTRTITLTSSPETGETVQIDYERS
jgi:hypothetical protein